MKPEKYKGVYWKLVYLPNVTDWYYQIANNKAMRNDESNFYGIKLNSLDGAIENFIQKCHTKQRRQKLTAHF